jgi:1-acyl-sn-glycerol-3-phosphate acyltransferase
MRVKVHEQVDTFKTRLDRRLIREEVRDIVYSQLLDYEK